MSDRPRSGSPGRRSRRPSLAGAGKSAIDGQTLHPNDSGYRAMAEAIDLRQLAP